MNYQHYSPEFKAKIVLQVLQGEKEIGELSQEYEKKTGGERLHVCHGE